MRQPQRRPNRRDKQETATRKAVILLALLCIAVGVMGYFYISARADIRPLDDTTYCPTDSKGVNSVTAVLIDLTDPFNPTQQAAIQGRLNDIKDHAGQYDLLEVYTVEPTKDKLLTPAFSMCSPGRGEGINRWIGNARLVEEHWKTLFAAPLQHLFDSILDGETAAISPIMESIQSIVVTRLGSEDLVSKKIPRRLIIVSDLLQYTKTYSQYQPFPPFKQFKTTPYFQAVRTDMSGISVEIWYVRRQKTLHLQQDKHMDFWRDYLTDQGASVDKFWFVPGM